MYYKLIQKTFLYILICVLQLITHAQANPVDDAAIKLLDYTYIMEIGSQAVLLRLQAEDVTASGANEDLWRGIVSKTSLGAHALVPLYRQLKKEFETIAFDDETQFYAAKKQYEQQMQQYLATIREERKILIFPEDIKRRPDFIAQSLESYANLLGMSTVGVYVQLAKALSAVTSFPLPEFYDLTRAKKFARSRIIFEELRRLKKVLQKSTGSDRQLLYSDELNKFLLNFIYDPAVVKYLAEVAGDILSSINAVLINSGWSPNDHFKTFDELLAAIDQLQQQFSNKEYPQINDITVDNLDGREYDSRVIASLTAEELQCIKEKNKLFTVVKPKPPVTT
ncbi:MAG: hypothetical protein OXD32_04985 [Endozoicomonadaceae bacterium]|nr:hypothetical protein [Endozoicomonadaceae bacterium]MCY4330608.1 hypothetical protein [Endozoicomonadaceae bacterium]